MLHLNDNNILFKQYFLTLLINGSISMMIRGNLAIKSAKASIISSDDLKIPIPVSYFPFS
ncbi:hypothetical protein BpHYR1_031524 [Brachionus plicatilis]|uniref:Uncharacterized protein n=1 Tax=Brachionus plicatilis TaxID=10195 RepID=A0A3M7T1S3_BRAPC|nr:hypothetical protein BpHYR1_031524 [Brachionus plicatilis]